MSTFHLRYLVQHVVQTKEEWSGVDDKRIIGIDERWLIQE